MEKWLLQARMQKGLSLLPFAHRLNYLFLQKSEYGKILPAAYYMSRLLLLRDHLLAGEQYLKGEKGRVRILETGTGLHPFTSIGLYLAGYNHITTLDTKKLITKHTLAQTLAVFREQELLGTLRNYIPGADFDRMQTIHRLHENMKRMNVEEVLRELGLQRITTKKLSALPFKSYSFDLLVSGNALQEMSVSVLMHLIPELTRVLVPGGIASHVLDLRDQFSYIDENISPFNYLKFSEEKWRSLTSKLVRQNRMRINFYRHLFKASGMEIGTEKNIKGEASQLEGMELDLTFEGVPKEDLLVLASHLVLKRG